MAAVKNALRIDASVTTDDVLISDCIEAATLQLEKTFGLCLRAQTWRLWLDRWPVKQDWVSPYSGYQNKGFRLSELKALEVSVDLGKFPALAISSFSIFDSINAESVIPSNQYFLDISGARLCLVPELFNWPTTDIRGEKAYKIQFTAGMTSVPADLKMAIQSFAMSIYNNRGCETEVPKSAYIVFQGYSKVNI